MKLLFKINLILLAVFAAGGLVLGYLARAYLADNARNQALAQARLLLESAQSVRDYTADDVSPLLQQNPRHKVRFLAETIPFFAATTTLSHIKKDYPDFSYREATLNPTNLEDRATDFETDVIRNFREHPELTQTSGDRPAALGRSLYLARPIRSTPECLQCHGLPSAAPPAMIAVYGTANGFGWKANEVVGTQIISVPLSMAVNDADHALQHLLILYGCIAIAAILIADLGFYAIVIRPLRSLSEGADRMSQGDQTVPPLPVKGSDEIASVSAAFNRMQQSLIKALKRPGQ